MDLPARTVGELAAHIGGRVVGDPAVVVTGVASLELATDRDIAYVEHESRFPEASASRAACVVVPDAAPVAANCRIETAKPKLAFVRIAELLATAPHEPPAVHPTAVIDASADLHPSVSVGPHACIGAHTRVGPGTRIAAGVAIGSHVTIGADCVFYPNVVIYDRLQIGDRVILHAGVCVGSDGFGYVRDRGVHRKFPQAGSVVIEDDVELGAGTCVDRGALDATRIGRGSKLDNLVHVGHNVNVGERVVIAAQTGISGSVVIEDDVVVGGQVGFGDHAVVRRGAMIGSKAGVLPGKIVRPGQWWGVPVQRLRDYKQLNAYWRRLPQMSADLRELRRLLREVQAWIARSGENGRK